MRIINKSNENNKELQSKTSINRTIIGEMCFIDIKYNVTIERNRDGPKIFIFSVQNIISLFFFTCIWGEIWHSHVSVKFTRTFVYFIWCKADHNPRLDCFCPAAHIFYQYRVYTGHLQHSDELNSRCNNFKFPRVEDLDDIMHIFAEQITPLVESHGPYFLSELIEAEDEENHTVVCEVSHGCCFFYNWELIASLELNNECG